MKINASLIFLIILIFCSENKKLTPPNYLSKKYALEKLKPSENGDSIAEQNKNNHTMSIYEKKYNDALILYKSKRYIDSVSKFEEALNIFTDAEIYYNYAKSLFSIGKFQESLMAYEIADILNYDKKANLYYHVACIYSLQNDLPSALFYLKQSITKGFTNFKHLKADSDLNFVKKQKNWEQILTNLISDKNLTKEPKEFLVNSNKKIKLKSNSKNIFFDREEIKAQVDIELFNGIAFYEFETFDKEDFYYKIRRQGKYFITKEGIVLELKKGSLHTNHPEEENSLFIKNKLGESVKYDLLFREKLNGFVFNDANQFEEIKEFALNKKECAFIKEKENCSENSCKKEYEQKGYFCTY